MGIWNREPEFGSMIDKADKDYQREFGAIEQTEK